MKSLEGFDETELLLRKRVGKMSGALREEGAEFPQGGAFQGVPAAGGSH